MFYNLIIFINITLLLYDDFRLYTSLILFVKCFFKDALG